MQLFAFLAYTLFLSLSRLLPLPLHISLTFACIICICNRYRLSSSGLNCKLNLKIMNIQPIQQLDIVGRLNRESRSVSFAMHERNLLRNLWILIYHFLRLDMQMGKRIDRQHHEYCIIKYILNRHKSAKIRNIHKALAFCIWNGTYIYLYIFLGSINYT